MPRHLLVISHNPEIGLGDIGPLLEKKGCTVTHANFRVVGRSDKPVDGVICLGGTCGVNDTDSWISGEVDYVRSVTEQGVPYLGICLGAQVLAAAMGGRVFRARKPELGMISIQCSAASALDPLFRTMPERFNALSWHGDTFEPPQGAVVLARSHDCVQAFRVGDTAYGIQFHPEASGPVLREWLQCSELKEFAESNLSAPQLLALLQFLDEGANSSLTVIVEEWLNLVEGDPNFFRASRFPV